MADARRVAGLPDRDDRDVVGLDLDPLALGVAATIATTGSATIPVTDGVDTALEDLAPADRPRVILCHIATADELRWLERMKARGFDVWGETCPHYLEFTQDDAQRAGARLQVNPPLRTDDDGAALRRALADGTIDFVASDLG